MATGSQPKDPGGHATWQRTEDTGKTKKPEMTVRAPIGADSLENLPGGAKNQTVKVDVDEKKILSVTTTFSVSPSSKRMLISGKSKTDTKPRGVDQGKAHLTPTESKDSPGSQKGKSETDIKPWGVDQGTALSTPTDSEASLGSHKGKGKTDTKPKGLEQGRVQLTPGESEASPGSQKVRKPSVPASPNESKSPASAAARANPRKDEVETPPSQSTKQTANKEVPNISSSEKYRTGSLQPDVTEKPVVIEDDEDDEEKSGIKTQKKDKKKIVIVQVIFYRFRDIDTKAETFDAEIILNAKWPEPSFDKSKSLPDRMLTKTEYSWSPELYIENIVNDPKIVSNTVTLRIAASGKAFVIESTKLFGTFSETMQLKDFPFDTQNMSLLIRTEKPSAEVHLTVSSQDPHMLRRSLYFQKQQFRLYMHVVTEDLTKVPYDEYGDVKTSDELKVICYAARNPVFYVIHCYLMAFLLCFLGFVSFSADAQYTMQRNVLSFFLMLGAVSHKYTLVPHIPKTSYMTHADRYCLATIIYLCLLSIWHAIMTLLDPQVRNNLDWIGIVVFGGMLVLYNIGSWRVFLTTTYLSRSALADEERKYITKLTILRKERATIDNVLSD